MSTLRLPDGPAVERIHAGPGAVAPAAAVNR
jgi:hypothetical protein